MVVGTLVPPVDKTRVARRVYGASGFLTRCSCRISLILALFCHCLLVFDSITVSLGYRLDSVLVVVLIVGVTLRTEPRSRPAGIRLL